MRLRHLQVQLQELHDSLRVGAADSVTEALVDIEAKALNIRAEQRAFGGDSTEALALAGRARIEMDDPRGALRLLTPAPRGIATAAEAQSAQVAHFAAIAAALRLNDVDLASELTDKVTPAIDRHFLRAATFSQAGSSRHLAWLNIAPRCRWRRRATNSNGPWPGWRAWAWTLLPTRQRRGSSRDCARSTRKPPIWFWPGRPWCPAMARRACAWRAKYRSLAAVELHADALSTLGRTEEAIDVLDEYGTRTGDVTIRMQALELAGRASFWPRAKQLADAIIDAAGPGPVRDSARRARSDIAARAGDWKEVEQQLRRVVRERAEIDDSLSSDPAESPYAWQLAEALFHQRKFSAALAMLRAEFGKSAADPGKVRLALALLHQLHGEHAELIDDTAVDWVLNVASSMVNHEDIGASAVMLLIQLPRALSDAKLVKASKLFDEYFDTYGDSGAVRKIDLPSLSEDPDDLDLQPLVDEMRISLQPSAKARGDVGEMVLAGRIPLGMLALVAKRSYAEVLLTRMLGQYVARPRQTPNAPLVVPAWLDNAKAALAAGTIVVDTSALVLAHKICTTVARCWPSSEKVLIPRTLQDDIYNARTRSALRSSASIGWNQAADKPALVEYAPDVVEQWARAAVELDEALIYLSPVTDAHLREEDPEAVTADLDDVAVAITAEATARQLGVALWADDAALLRLAEFENVPVFGTPELIAALREGSKTMPNDLQLLELLHHERVVDLPVIANWAMTARADRWAWDSYLLFGHLPP